ncbi:MAG: J domain-containing protein [Desulfuromonadia bacterium]
MTYDDLHWARTLFSLPERVTVRDIRDRYRELASRHHPDISGDQTISMADINRAWEILNTYIQSYRLSLTEEEFCRQDPEEMVRRQFSDDPIWGGGR